MDGDDSIHSLATAVDTMLGVAAAGQVTIPIVAANTAASASVTLPAGRFTGTLAGNATPFGSQPDNFRCSVGVLNANSMVIWGLRTSGTATFAVSWSVQAI
jgi:hypothetical protein